jgi:TetR/AcrR family transcriptional repressor of nem operon
MRYGVKRKEESRDRILSAAGRSFRASGTESVRVSDVMQAVGMTHGGFYKHFSNKEQLVHEAIETALVEVSSALTKMTRGMSRNEALRAVITFYLSEEHMLHPDLGCALAALGTEMARMAPETKAAVSKALDAYADRLSYLMPGKTRAQQRAAFLVLFPSMAGCMMTARAHADRERQLQILAGGRAFFTQAFCSQSATEYLEVLL